MRSLETRSGSHDPLQQAARLAKSMANGTQEKDLDRIVHILANEIHLASYILQILDAELHYGQIHDILQSCH